MYNIHGVIQKVKNVGYVSVMATKHLGMNKINKNIIEFLTLW